MIDQEQTKMKLEIKSIRFVRPSSPTPLDLRKHEFSLLDQFCPAVYANITFFYPSSSTEKSTDTDDPDDLVSDELATKSKLLQESLSKTLAVFRPFAGRFSDAASSIDCNDEGAFFIEAKIDTKLSKFLDHPEHSLINQLSPISDPKTMKLANGALLLVQLNGFSCGGVALSLSITHKVVDAATMITSLRSWTAIAHEKEPLVPQWDAANILPPMDSLLGMSVAPAIKPTETFVSRRFVFSCTKIAGLKAKSNAEGKMQHNSSRVELVLALLWKCAIAANKEKSGSFKPSALLQALNLRTRMTPTIPDTTMGNFVWPFMVTLQDEMDLQVYILADKIRNAYNEFCKNKGNKFRGKEGSLMVLGDAIEKAQILQKSKDWNVYNSSSWCNFPLYDTDFGWGKPLWHTNVNTLVSNVILLFDTRSGTGIEALVTLNVEEMAIFERNEELREFALINPSAYP